MQEVEKLHREAMELADAADAAKREGLSADATRLNRQAFKKEQRAAELVAENDDLEPTRSVLHRSAASLALACGELAHAEVLITRALSKQPPPEIAEELRDLWSDVDMHRHHDLHGIKLDDTELQLSLAGASIGFGFSPIAEFLPRVQNVSALLRRTAERLLGFKYQAQGRRKKELTLAMGGYMSVARAGSFATTLRFGANPKMIPGTDFIPESINDFLDCLDCINRNDIAALQNQIENEAYFQSFIELAQQIAPDGEKVRSVGFTTSHTAHKNRTLVLTKEARMIKSMRPVIVDDSTTRAVKIIGTLLEADATKENAGSVEIVDSRGTKYKVQVQRRQMADIVKPMFEEHVVVTGHWRGKNIICENISRAESENA